jgi:hypothetical protein
MSQLEYRRWTWKQLNRPSYFTRLTRPYRPRYDFRSIRPGTEVKWFDGKDLLTGQVWSRAPGSGNWWLVTPDGKAHKVHWKKFSDPKTRWG